MSSNLYVRVLQRYKITILVAVILAVATAAIATLFLPKSYTARSTLRIATSVGGSLDYVNYQTDYSDRFMNTLAKYAADDRIADGLQARFGLAKPPRIKAAIIAKTELLDLSVEAPTPELAANLTNALNDIVIAQGKTLPSQDLELAQSDLKVRMIEAQQAIDKAQNVYQTALIDSPGDTKLLGTLRQQVDLKERLYLSLLDQFNRVRIATSILGESIVVEHAATPPTTPSSPSWPINLGLGALLGLVGGIGFAFFSARNDTRLYVSEEVQTQLPILLLGEIPLRKKRTGPLDQALAPVFEDNSMELEGIRRVRVNLIALQQRLGFKTIAVVSAEPGEGKSTLVANLAASLAHVGQRVAVIDADLRMPTLHESFQVPNQVGLSTMLSSNQVDVPDVIQNPTSNISVITSGERPNNPGELLDSPRMLSIINRLAEDHDWVLVDTPALLMSADGIDVARMTGHAIFVASCQVASRETVDAASRQIVDLGVNLLGLVVNGTKRPRDYGDSRLPRSKKRYLA